MRVIFRNFFSRFDVCLLCLVLSGILLCITIPNGWRIPWTRLTACILTGLAALFCLLAHIILLWQLANYLRQLRWRSLKFFVGGLFIFLIVDVFNVEKCRYLLPRLVSAKTPEFYLEGLESIEGVVPDEFLDLKTLNLYPEHGSTSCPTNFLRITKFPQHCVGAVSIKSEGVLFMRMVHPKTGVEISRSRCYAISPLSNISECVAFKFPCYVSIGHRSERGVLLWQLWFKDKNQQEETKLLERYILTTGAY